MAPARKRKREPENVITELKLEDVMCPVCRGIVIEPVSLPCKHVLCYYCFDKTVENNTLTCPICRKRIGGWLRTATKNRTLINAKLWLQVQEKFPEQIRNKQIGEDDGVEEEVIGREGIKKLSTPGEIRQEFEEQLKQISEQYEKKHRKNEEASADYIRNLLVVELEQSEARRKEQQKIVDKDELYARSLQSSAMEPECILREGSSSAVSSASVKTDTNSCSSTSRPMSFSKKAKVTKVPVKIENYFRVERRNSCSSSESQNSGRNSIDAELNHFKPILSAPKTPPKKMPDGTIIDSNPRKIKPMNLEKCGKFSIHTPCLTGPNILLTDGPKAFSLIQPTARISTTEVSGNITDNEASQLQLAVAGPSTSTASINLDIYSIYELEEKELLRRLQQEEQDRKLAEHLQELWDIERGRTNKTDSRRKGRGYELRSATKQTTLDNHVQPVPL